MQKLHVNEESLPPGPLTVNRLSSRCEGGALYIEIYVMDADGGNQQRLTEQSL